MVFKRKNFNYQKYNNKELKYGNKWNKWEQKNYMN